MRGALLGGVLGALAFGVDSAVAGQGRGRGQGGNSGGGKGRPGSVRIELTNTGADADAAGRLDLKHFPAVGKRTERSWFRIKAKRLDPNAAFTLWMDDPSTDLDPALVQVTDVTIQTSDEGGANFRIDTKHGGTLPFGATLAGLVGMNFEVRDVANAAVLLGTVPAVQ